MSNTIAKIVRREIDSARNRSGMQAGLPKVTIEASHAEYLCRMAERTAELEKENHMLKRMREKYDCRFAGDYVEVSGKHCPIGEPCVRCQLEAFTEIDAQENSYE